MTRSRHLILVPFIVILASFLAGGTASATVRATNWTVTQAVTKLPAWNVTGPALSAASAQGLADSLGLPDSGFDPNTNSMSFFDPSFMAIPSNLTGEEGKDESGNPTQVEAIDYDGLKAMTAFPAQDAIDAFQGALADNQLEPMDGTARVSRTLSAADSFFDVFFTNPDGGIQENLHLPFATTASWQISLGTQGIPLVGPGAKVSATFDGDGVPTQVHYALRMMSQGQNVVMITPAQANKAAVSQVKSQCGTSQLKNLRLTTKPVYFAPPLDLKPSKIFPWYQVDGTAMVGDQLIQLRSLLVPGVQAGPKANIVASVKGNLVTGRAIVKGGTPPYTYQWTSCSQSLNPADATGQSVEYRVGGRASSSIERLNLVATDANGLTAQAIRTLTVQQTTGGFLRFTQGRRTINAIGPIDVGAETVGTSMGLPGCIPDTTGFVGRMAFSGVPTEFQWYNGNAWEQDFKDPSKAGGDDTNYADHVDETFYCGHANGNGFSFPGSHTDGFLNYTDAYWGNYDLEWLGIAACGPLQSGSPDWWQRWGPAFGGLHLLLGYQTTSYDATGEGFAFANGQLGPFWWGSPMTVLQSWVQMAISNQPSSVYWAVMGVIGSGGVSNYNDYFWGRGPTGPDIQPSNIVAYWKVSGPS